MPRCHVLAESLGLKGKFCISYIGSLYPWEGVDCLIRAMPHVHEALPEARLLVVGKGEEYGRLQRLVAKHRCGEFVRLVGHVAREEVSKYYSVADVLVYPRRMSRQTELVSPLKPLEALSMRRAVIAADVGGLCELLGGAASYFRSGDTADLARACIAIGKEPETRHRLAVAGRTYVLAERDWKDVIQKYRAAYDFAALRE